MSTGTGPITCRASMDGVPLDGGFFRKLLLSNMLVLPFALLAWQDGSTPALAAAVLMWLAGLILLWPRFGEIHAMGHLPFTAVMSGSGPGLAIWPQLVKNSRSLGCPADRAAWAGAEPRPSAGCGPAPSSYIPTRLGAGAIAGL